MPHRHNVGKLNSVLKIHFYLFLPGKICISNVQLEEKKNVCLHIVGLILDQTRGSSGPSDTGGNFTADSVDAARKKSSILTTGIVSQSSRCIHVSLYDFRVHGPHGILPCEHSTDIRGRFDDGKATAASTCACTQCRRTGSGQTRSKDFRHCQQGCNIYILQAFAIFDRYHLFND